MKKIFLYTLMLGLFALASCDDETNPILELRKAAEFQPLAKTEFVFNKDNATQAFPTIKWARADFGVSAVVNYSVVLTNTDSKKSVVIGETGNAELQLTNAQMNAWMAKVGGYPGQTYNFTISLDVKAYDSASGPASNTLSFKAKLYDPKAVDWNFAYIAVSHPDWDYTSAFMLGDPDEDGVFHGYAYFDTDGLTYKVVDGKDVTKELSKTTGTVAKKGFYEITVDASGNLTQSEPLSWAIIGDATSGGWSSDTKMEYDANARVWKVVATLLNKEFKFRANSNWGINLGALKDKEGEITGAVVPNGSNIKVMKAHAYIVTLDLCNADKPTYKLVETTVEQSSAEVFLPGSYQGWDPAAATCYKVTSPARDFTYSGVFYFPANTQFKYFDGGTWIGIPSSTDVAWNADHSSASFTINAKDSKDITIAYAGWYHVNVDTKKLTSTFVKSGWEIIGSATPGSWDKGTIMNYDPVTKLWSIDITLTDGEFKFRWDASWEINLGGALSGLTQGGDNLKITAGTYTVVLNPANNTATVTKK